MRRIKNKNGTETQQQTFWIAEDVNSLLEIGKLKRTKGGEKIQNHQ